MLEVIAGQTETFEALNRDFLTRCGRDAQRLLALEGILAASESSELRGNLEAIRHVAHQMRGAAPSFAEPEIGMIAGSLEDAIIKALAWNDDTLAGASLGRARDLLRKLYIALGCVWLSGRGHTPLDEPHPLPGETRADPQRKSGNSSEEAAGAGPDALRHTRGRIGPGERSR